MATGKNGYFDIYGSRGFTARIHWAETYDIATNTSILSVTKLEFKSTNWYGVSYYLEGTIKVDNKAIVTFDAGQGTHAFNPSTLNAFYPVKGTLEGAPESPWNSSAIEHNADGSKEAMLSLDVKGYTLSGNAGNGWSASGSSAITLTTIPRKSFFYVATDDESFPLGNPITFRINKQASVFTDTLSYKCGNASGTIFEKSTATEFEWTPPLDLAQQNTTGTNLVLNLTLTTYSGSTEVGTSTMTLTLTIPESVKPSVSVTVDDLSGCFAKYGKYVQGQSELNVKLTTAGSYGSEITSKSVAFDGRSYADSDEFTTEIISGSGGIYLTATVKDSRGRTASVDVVINTLEYKKPKISSLTVQRCDSAGIANSTGEYLKVSFDAAITSLDGKNGAIYQLEYKKIKATSYTAVTLALYSGVHTVDDGSFIFAADKSSSYNVRLTATDDFDDTTRNGTGVSIALLFSWLKEGLGWAFGKVAELADTLDVAWKIRARNGIEMDDSNGNIIKLPDGLFVSRGHLGIGSDLNDVMTPGMYLLHGAEYVNAPFNNCFFLVFDSAGSTIQVLISNDGTQRKLRTIWFGTANAWQDI